MEQEGGAYLRGGGRHLERAVELSGDVAADDARRRRLRRWLARSFFLLRTSSSLPPPLMGEIASSRMSPSPRPTTKPEPPHPRWIPSLRWLVPSGGNGGGGMRVAAGRNPRSAPVPASFASASPATRRGVTRVADGHEGGKAAGAQG
jgi:hypothetical protein